MNFEELLKYCTELNESKNEKCLVCHIPVDSDEKYIKLECSHIFHPDCIKYKSGSLKCLYCEKSSTPNLINYSNSNQLPLVPNLIYCKMILKTGPKAGQPCGRLECKYHNNQNDKASNKKTKSNSTLSDKNKITNNVEPITETSFSQILQMSGNDFIDGKDWEEDLIEV